MSGSHLNSAASDAAAAAAAADVHSAAGAAAAAGSGDQVQDGVSRRASVNSASETPRESIQSSPKSLSKREQLAFQIKKELATLSRENGSPKAAAAGQEPRVQPEESRVGEREISTAQRARSATSSTETVTAEQLHSLQLELAKIEGKLEQMSSLQQQQRGCSCCCIS